METVLKDFRERTGILIGVCDALPLDYLTGLLQAAQTPFVSRDLRRRIDPRAILPSAESVIVIGVSTRRAGKPPRDGVLRGRLAAIAAIPDYHETVTGHLNALASRMLDKQSFEYRAFVDAGHLNERALAVKAGLGFLGKNGSVISEKYGSFFNIGYMLTDIKLNLTTQQPKPSACGGCNRCIDACIGSALGESGFNAHKCVSYLTQKKSAITEDEARTMSGWLYGCDVCQNVCPFNAPEKAADVFCYPAISECEGISAEDFDRRYKNSALHWRGAEIFRRNAAIARQYLDRE